MPFLQLITRMNLSRPWLWSRFLLILSSSSCYHLGKSKWTCNVTVAPNSTQRTVMISYTLEANRWLLGGERGLKSYPAWAAAGCSGSRISTTFAWVLSQLGAGMGGLRNLIPGLQRVLSLPFDTFHIRKDSGSCTTAAQCWWDPKDLSVRLLFDLPGSGSGSSWTAIYNK